MVLFKNLAAGNHFWLRLCSAAVMPQLLPQQGMHRRFWIWPIGSRQLILASASTCDPGW
jgi:hypothetical protein